MNVPSSLSPPPVRILLTLFLAFAPCACSYARVGSGEVAIVRTPDGVRDKVYPPGDWQIGMLDAAINYSVRSQERAEQLEVLASNGLRIVLDTSLRFHIIPGEAVALDRELGADYYGVLLGPTLRSQARRVVGRFQPEEIYSTQRELIEREIREGIEAAIKGRHVILEAVLVRNVTLPPSIQAAINTKLEAEQSALKMKYVLAQSAAQEQDKLMQVKAQVRAPEDRRRVPGRDLQAAGPGGRRREAYRWKGHGGLPAARPGSPVTADVASAGDRSQQGVRRFSQCKAGDHGRVGAGTLLDLRGLTPTGALP